MVWWGRFFFLLLSNEKDCEDTYKIYTRSFADILLCSSQGRRSVFSAHK